MVQYAGRFAESEALVERQRRGARELGHVLAWLLDDGCRGYGAFYASGDVAALEAFGREIQETWRPAGPWSEIGALTEARARHFRGDWEGAHPVVEGAIPRFTSEHWRDWFWSTAFLLRTYLGRDDALPLLDAHWARLPSPGHHAFIGARFARPDVVEGLVVLGERERAAALYEMARAGLDLGRVCWPGGVFECHAGLAAAAGRRWDVAEAHFESALRTAQRLPHRVAEPETRGWHAWMLLERGASGDRARAHALLEDAAAAYRAFGMPMRVAICEAMRD